LGYKYDIEVFMGNQSATPTVSDESMITNWFSSRNFEYLFLPDYTFMTKIISSPLFSTIMNEIDQIWDNENYISLLGSDVLPGTISWFKMVFARHYLIYTNKTGSKFINRTCQLLAPDGTWGFIYSHFFNNYCGAGNYTIIPLLRKENGLVFDFITETYPQEVTDHFVSMIPAFNQFRIDHDLTKLNEEVEKVLTHDGITKFQTLFLVSIDHFNSAITLNKSILKITVRNNFLRDNGQYDVYRLWEYDTGI